MYQNMKIFHIIQYLSKFIVLKLANIITRNHKIKIYISKSAYL